VPVIAREYRHWLSEMTVTLGFYRVSIKYFPDYKHILQENYVGYIFFLPLLNLVSTILCHVIKPRRMRWAGHVARMGEGKGVYSLGGETGGKETTGET
jgi:hypothetical protein